MIWRLIMYSSHKMKLPCFFCNCDFCWFNGIVKYASISYKNAKTFSFWQFYGKPLWEGIQAPNEVIYLPHDMIHTVLNLEDNVAITENFLFVDAISGFWKLIRPKHESKILMFSDLIKHVVFDEIPIWRPGWVDNLWKKLYFSKYLQSQVSTKHEPILQWPWVFLTF